MGKKKVSEEVGETCDIFARKCDGKRCCQAKTVDGGRCSRPAVYQMDLTQGVNLAGGKVRCPGVGCCFVCTQHLKKTLVTGIANLTHQVVKLWGTSKLDYDEYYTIFEDEDPLRA